MAIGVSSLLAFGKGKKLQRNFSDPTAQQRAQLRGKPRCCACSIKTKSVQKSLRVARIIFSIDLSKADSLSHGSQNIPLHKSVEYYARYWNKCGPWTNWE